MALQVGFSSHNLLAFGSLFRSRIALAWNLPTRASKRRTLTSRAGVDVLLNDSRLSFESTTPEPTALNSQRSGFVGWSGRWTWPGGWEGVGRGGEDGAEGRGEGIGGGILFISELQRVVVSVILDH